MDAAGGGARTTVLLGRTLRVRQPIGRPGRRGRKILVVLRAQCHIRGCVDLRRTNVQWTKVDHLVPCLARDYAEPWRLWLWSEARADQVARGAVCVRAELDIFLEDELRRIVREEVSRALAETCRPAEWQNVKSAAAYLDTTEDAVRALVRRGQLPAHRSEVGTLRFLRDELDAHARGLD